VRILIVTSEAPPIVSGISRCVGRLADGLRARGHEVDVLSSVQMRRLVLGEVRLSSFALHWPRVAARMRRYDVVNLHGPVPTLSDVFLMLHGLRRRAGRTPVVYTHHSAIELEGFEIASDLYNVVHKWLTRAADIVLTTSSFYRDTLFSPSRRPARVVPWGVDPVLDPVRDRPATPHRPADDLEVLFVGQMRPYKGVGVLLDAVQDVEGVNLTLVGSGPELPLYRSIVAERGAANVRFRGRVDDEELARAYGEADVVVLPSLTRAEAFGLVVLEGMANGDVPVVSDLPGVRDLATGPGLVVPPHDAGALRDALVRLADDPDELHRRQRAALVRATELSWDACIDGYERALREAVEERDGGSADGGSGGAAHEVPAAGSGARRPAHRRAPGRRLPTGPRSRRGVGVRVRDADAATPGARRPGRLGRMLRTAAVFGLPPLIALPLFAGCSAGAASDDRVASGATSGGGTVFGTLLSEPASDAREAAGGVGGAMVELEWRLAEPERGEFDRRYLAGVGDRIRELQDDGRDVALGLGLHYAPRWALDLPDARLVDQDGRRSDQLNLVFDADARAAAEDYLAAVADEVDFADLQAVRFTSGGSGEVLYPDDGSYWAFDANALGGSALPATLTPNPEPEWRPGDASLGREATAAWADWYVGALADAVDWQRGVVADLGFRGDEQVLTPGVGVTPAEWDAAVGAGLPEGLLGAGAAWDRLYAALDDGGHLVAYSTSLGDGSGGDSVCRPGDDGVEAGAISRDSWSAARWLARIARERGLELAGENPGYRQPVALADSYVDTGPDGMMAAAFAQVAACGYARFYWAHDAELWDGTVDGDVYLERIADARSGGAAS